MEQEQTTLLKDYPIQEKGAYFCALATMASADGHASDEELEFLDMMGEAAELPENLRQEVEQVAKNPSQVSLQKCLDTLKSSPLRFSLITDIISFAKSDGQYTQEEQQRIEEMATYLGVDHKQYSLLEQYVEKAGEAQQQGVDPTSQSFLNKNGFGDMFKNAGISPQMVKGMLGILAPIVIAKMMGGRRSKRYGGGMMGGLLGGLLGGGMMGRRSGGMGSMASILSGLNGRKGYSSMGSGGLGGLLGGILGGGKRRGGW
ncbi:tellurite resistance TerB family protein [Pontibacter flavimaris]|uniref:Tellurite resistance protein n=1 Tax=Pontibacter flavimaris TaxID=1797110 RepID=A0A1Q5PB69_9BACT|nr:TerB family tellurite resistance protein [Pontibacter flavimaris]OKL39453.1 Tellurite resistance protein [Pontibacter flavimaris]